MQRLTSEFLQRELLKRVASDFLQKATSKSKFFCKKINDKEYEHVITVWNRFEMKIMKDYHDLFLKCDVLLLPDLFEKIRRSSLKNYGLCPSPYLRTLALILGSMRNMTNANLRRYNKVNNKYLKPCNLKQESKHIIYLDANDVYDV